MAKITINNISLDPEQQREDMQTFRLTSVNAANSNYILIQTRQPLNRAQKAELANSSVEILEYVPERAYVCRYTPSDLNVLRALPYVEWVNVYLENFKVDPKLRGTASAAPATNLLALSPINRSRSQQPKQIEVVLHQNVEITDELRQQLADAARLNIEDLQFGSHSIRLSVQPQYLEDLAKIDRVRSIEEHVVPKLCNNVAVGVLKADRVHSSGLEGANQTIAICDTGFDKGSTSNVHPAFQNRVVKLYALGRSTANDPDGHGTHVAGSVLGDGTSTSMGGAIRGTAPKAKLVLQSVLDRSGGLGGLPFDLNDLFRVPYDNDGARVHTNSWGADVSGAYTQNSEQVDRFVWQHRDCVICFAAGNEGVDRDLNGVIDVGSIGAPGSAKNCITVGATENDRSDQSKPYSQLGYSAEPIASDGWSDDPEGMVAFSSRGPTRNQRIKPDVVAPGTAILSTLSRDARIDDFFGKSLDPLYAFLAGTSMATPLVAGCAALVREYFQTKHGHQPSAALVKAMLINGAKNISGQYVPSESGRIPNFSEGFGRVDLDASVADPVTFKDEGTELDTEEEETTEVTISSPNSVLKVTLVWTDPPGEALQNDLDLIVRGADGKERHGNMRGTSSKFDRVNNVEQVIWPNAPVGTVKIVVRAYRAILPQSYALVIRVV
jgi:serine protease AprX